jgi:DNA-binding MarR family transcriptional regulator
MSTTCAQIFNIAERSHRQFLDIIQIELDRLKIRDINNVRALILLNIGKDEMTVSELIYRGCYLGTNVSYNLKKLTEAHYVEQVRSPHDRRVIMVRNSTKGHAICIALENMTNHTCEMMSDEALQPEKLEACLKTLTALQGFWQRSMDRRVTPGLQLVA